MVAKVFSGKEEKEISPHETASVLEVHKAAVMLLENAKILCRPFEACDEKEPLGARASSSSASSRKRYHLEKQRQIMDTRRRLLESVRKVLEDGCRRLRESPTCYEFSEMATECLWRSFRRLFAGFPRVLTPAEFDECRSECSRSLVAFRICVSIVFGLSVSMACLAHDVE